MLFTQSAAFKGTTEFNSGQYISKTEPQGGKGPKTNKQNKKPGKKSFTQAEAEKVRTAWLNGKVKERT